MAKKDVGYYIKNIDEKLKVKADADLGKYNLTFAQSRVLAFLRDKGGSATQKEIEVFLEVSHPTVVGIVSRMEKNGHLKCRFDENDRRNKIVELTQQAEKLGKDMERSIKENENRMLKSLSQPEIKQLMKMLEIISKNLD